MSYSIEQLVHDKINLKSLVRRLEKSVSDPFWDESPEDDAWIKSQGTLQVSSCPALYTFRLTCLSIESEVCKEATETCRTL